MFVGREREMEQLHAAVDDASDGRGRLVLIAGEPGIGKTRLADELAGAAARRGAHVLWGRCWEGDGAPAFWPWIQILRVLVRERHGPALAADLGSAATDVVQLVPELRKRLSLLATPGPALDPEQARFRLFDGLTSFLKRTAAKQPLVLILDDLHCADNASVLLLEFFVGQLFDAHVLMVATYRDTEVNRDHHLSHTLGALARHQFTQRLPLRGLSVENVRRFVAGLTGTTPSAALVSTLHRDTEGNPLFIDELVRWLDAEGRLESPPSGSVLPLPPTIRDVIGRRLSRLSSDCNETLGIASVVGREFTLRLLEHMTSLPAGRLLAVLDEAVAARIVAQDPDRIGTYRFSHVMVRDALYEAQPASRRVQLHRGTGQALEQLYEGRLPLATLAHHFFQAAAGDDAEKAIAYAERAGRHASSVFAYEEAAAHMELALRASSLARHDERRRFEILLALGEALRKAGHVARAREIFLEAAALARRLGDATLLGRAGFALGEPWASWGFSDQVLVDVLEDAHTGLGDQDSALHARVLAGLVLALDLPAAEERPRQLVQQAIAMARRVGDQEAELFSLFAQQNLWWPHDARERLHLHTEILDVAERVGDKETIARARFWRRCDLEELGDMRAADDELRRCVALADELRQPRYHWQIALARGMRALMRGRFEDGEKLITEAWDIGQRGTEATVADEFAWMQLFTLRRAQGRLEELEPAIAMAVEKYPAYIGVRTALAVLYWETGRADEARALLEAVVPDTSFEAPEEQFRLISLALLAELCAFLNEGWRAERLYELLRPYASRNVIVGIGAACEGSASRHLGLLAGTLSRWELAEQHFRDALQMNGRLQSPPLMARTQLDFARMLLLRGQPGDREQAPTYLAKAAGVFQKLAMHGYLRQAEALQHNTTAGGEPAPASDAVQLTRHPQGGHVFKQEGEFWSIGYGAAVFRLKDISGLHYIAELLRHPGGDIHVLDLVTVPSDQGSDKMGRGIGAAQLERRSIQGALSHAGVMLDAEARAAYRQRLRELREDLEEAESINDAGRVSRIRNEIEMISEQLAAAFGRGGRTRRGASAVERARINVKNSITLALKRIRQHDKDLWRHLSTAIKTGTVCSYGPDRSIPWQF